jgi:hypothetical protein
VTLCSTVWERYGADPRNPGVYVSASRVAVFKAPAAGTFTLTIQALGRANSAGYLGRFNLDDIVVTVTN